MNTLASSKRQKFYRIKLAQSAYYANNFNDYTVKIAQYALPLAEKLLKLSQDKNSLWQNKGLYPQEWGKTWETINQGLTAWRDLYSKYASYLGDKMPPTVAPLALAVQKSTEIITAYNSSMEGEKAQASPIAGWLKINVGDNLAQVYTNIRNTQIDRLFGPDYFNKFLNLIEQGIDKLKNYFESIKVEEGDPKFTACDRIINNIDNLKDLYENAYNLYQEGRKDQFKKPQANMAWKQVSAVVSQIESDYNYLVDSQISQEDSPQAFDARFNAILKPVQELYNALSQATSMTTKPEEQMSLEESAARDRYKDKFK